jgi:hypothetical protein
VISQLHAPAVLPPGGRTSGTNWKQGWMVSRAGLEEVEKRKFLTLPALELEAASRYTDCAIPASSFSVVLITLSNSGNRSHSCRASNEEMTIDQ